VSHKCAAKRWDPDLITELFIVVVEVHFLQNPVVRRRYVITGHQVISPWFLPMVLFVFQLEDAAYAPTDPPIRSPRPRQTASR